MGKIDENALKMKISGEKRKKKGFHHSHIEHIILKQILYLLFFKSLKNYTYIGLVSTMHIHKSTIVV